MGNQDSDSGSKEQDNQDSERAMCEAVGKIQSERHDDPYGFIKKIQQIQQESWNHRWRKVTIYEMK
jgi:hypothetical protein